MAFQWVSMGLKILKHHLKPIQWENVIECSCTSQVPRPRRPLPRPPGKVLEIHVAVRLRGALAPGVDAAPEVRFAGPWVEAQTLNPKDGALVGFFRDFKGNEGKMRDKMGGK